MNVRDTRLGSTIRCFRCGVPTTIDTHQKLYTYWKSERLFCATDCRDKTVSEESSLRMAATNRRFASARMTARNPMRFAENRQKMSRTLKAMHWKPKSQGGNGRPTPVQQAALAEALGWPVEVAVVTGQARGGLYPSCYKIDIGNVEVKVGVEVDGNSHFSRRELDAKKDAFLAGLGWTILRFTNKQVEADTPACVRAVLAAVARARCS